MSGPRRSPDKTAISVSMTLSELADVDARAKSLHLNRSQYLTQLARADIANGGEFTLRETPPVAPAPVAAPITSYSGATKADRERIKKLARETTQKHTQKSASA